MRYLMLAAVLLLTPGAAAAQCCGDCDGDGEVTINELITAVNNALNGCSAVMPCPIDFADDNTIPGTPDCYYIGGWNQSCGGDDLEALWRSDGEILIVQLLGFDEGIFFGADVIGAGSAELFCWYVQEDAGDCDQNPISGAIALADGGGLLTMTPGSPPFTIDECALARYRGTLSDVVSGATARAARAVAPPTRQALQRLRDRAPSRPAGRDFRRR